MENFQQNVKTDTEPECYMCCGTTCDRTKSISEHRQLEANNHELGQVVQQFYAWYLESQELVEKLRVEVTVLKRELKHEKKKHERKFKRKGCSHPE